MGVLGDGVEHAFGHEVGAAGALEEPLEGGADLRGLDLAELESGADAAGDGERVACAAWQ